MLFTSVEFLLLFMPVVFGIYYILPKSAKNYWLLLTSLFFYAWGEPIFVLIMICSIVINYSMARLIENNGQDKKTRKTILVLDIAINLGILFVFKYLNFVNATLRGMFPNANLLFPPTNIALPIGISFFTFQALSYVIDVYRGIPAQKNPFFLGLYISLFPQLIAGPIVRYTTVMDQIEDRKVTLDSFSGGVVRFMVGFNKKMLLANTLSEAADLAFSVNGGSVGFAWVGAVCYTLQIFFDFSGYSDMAIGLGQMLGFQFLENFDYPYISQTITEFWRRWHISLGTWFRDYVYFPLGGSRVDTRRRLVFNLLVVWLLTGIWHGANWTFILWGLFYGIIIVIEKLTDLPKRLERAGTCVRVGYRLLTLLMIVCGWVLFRADNLSNAVQYLSTMFGFKGPAIDDRFIFYGREYMMTIVFGILLSTPLVKWLAKSVCGNHARSSVVAGCLYDGLQLVLFICSFSFLIMKAHNPFIYFNF